MSTQPPPHLQLSSENCQRLALLAQREGKSANEVLAERLSDVSLSNIPTSDDETLNSRFEGRTALDAFRDAGLVGAMDGPADLSTNPAHMEGFGRQGQPVNTD